MRKKAKLLITLLMTMVMIAGASLSVCAASSSETVLSKTVALDGVNLTISGSMYQELPGNQFSDNVVNVIVTNTSGETIYSPEIYDNSVIEADKQGGYMHSSDENYMMKIPNGGTTTIQFKVPSGKGINTALGSFQFRKDSTARSYQAGNFTLTGWKSGDLNFIIPAGQSVSVQPLPAATSGVRCEVPNYGYFYLTDGWKKTSGESIGTDSTSVGFNRQEGNDGNLSFLSVFASTYISPDKDQYFKTMTSQYRTGLWSTITDGKLVDNVYALTVEKPDGKKAAMFMIYTPKNRMLLFEYKPNYGVTKEEVMNVAKGIESFVEY